MYIQTALCCPNVHTTDDDVSNLILTVFWVSRYSGDSIGGSSACQIHVGTIDNIYFLLHHDIMCIKT